MSLDPAVVALITGLAATAVVYLGYRQSKKVDRSTEAATVAAGRSQEITQLIDGLDRHVENLQEDNRVLRDALAVATAKLDQAYADRDEMRQSVATLSARVDACIKERDELRAEVARMNQLLDDGAPSES